MNDNKVYINYDNVLKNLNSVVVADPLEALSNQHKSGIDMLKAQDNLIFYVNTGRSREFIEMFHRLKEQYNFWREGVISNLRQADWIPKRLEGSFTSNKLPLLDPSHTDPDRIIKVFFQTLHTDINLTSEIIDYGRSIQNNKQEENNSPRVSYSKQDGFIMIDDIKLSLGLKEQAICNIIFANKKLLNKNWLFDELLEEKSEQLRSNDISIARQIQAVKTRINKRIAENTSNNIKDVFIGHGSIQLNPKYC